jgi:hypothetical protein
VGVKNGKPYVGYASMPGLNRSGEEVLRYRYSSFGHFDMKPQFVYVGNGLGGKSIARGMEDRLFEKYGGLEGTSNMQKPVGDKNPSRSKYLKAADDYMKSKDAGGKNARKDKLASE